MATTVRNAEFELRGDGKKRCWCGTPISRSNPNDTCWIHLGVKPPVPTAPKITVMPAPTTPRPQPQPKPAASIVVVDESKNKPTAPQQRERISSGISYRRFTATQSVNAAAKFYGVDPRAIMGQSRQHPIEIARQVVAYLISKRVDGASMSWAGYHFLKHHHTTIMHACEVIDRGMACGETLREAVETIWETAAHMPGDSLLPFPFEKSKALAREAFAVIEDRYGIPAETLQRPGRKGCVARVRRIAIYLLHETKKLSFVEVDGLFREAMSTGAVHSCATMRRAIKNDPRLREEVEKMRAVLLAGRQLPALETFIPKSFEK